MKCKVITIYKTDLEGEVNNWLNSGKYEIIHTEQTQVDGYVTLTIFYMELKEVRSKKLDNIEKIRRQK